MDCVWYKKGLCKHPDLREHDEESGRRYSPECDRDKWDCRLWLEAQGFENRG